LYFLQFSSVSLLVFVFPFSSFFVHFLPFPFPPFSSLVFSLFLPLTLFSSSSSLFVHLSPFTEWRSTRKRTWSCWSPWRAPKEEVLCTPSVGSGVATTWAFYSESKTHRRQLRVSEKWMKAAAMARVRPAEQEELLLLCLKWKWMKECEEKSGEEKRWGREEKRKDEEKWRK
jgi:hypothetical protein